MFQELKCNGKAVKTLLRSAQRVAQQGVKAKAWTWIDTLSIYRWSKHSGVYMYSLVWPIQGCAARQDMVFVLSVLNKVYNFV